MFIWKLLSHLPLFYNLWKYHHTTLFFHAEKFCNRSNVNVLTPNKPWHNKSKTCLYWLNKHRLVFRYDFNTECFLDHMNLKFILASFFFIEKYLICKHFFSITVPSAYRHFWARDWIQVAPGSYATAVATPDPSTHCTGLGIEPVTPQLTEPLQ